MRILIYSANFAPEPTGIGKYSGEMAGWLAGQGHAVRVVAAPPYYPEWKVDPRYLRPRYRRERRDGVDVWRAPIWVPKVPTGTLRVLHLISFAITSFPVILWQILWRPDVVIVVAPAFVCAPAALLAARLCGADAWLHLQDFEVDVAFELGLLRGRLLQRLTLRVERWLMRRFDVVSTISSRMVERLLTKGVSAERTRYFPNWVDTAHVRPSHQCPGYRQQLGIAGDAVVILYSGSLGAKQGLPVIPQMAKALAHRTDVQFVVCGDGVLKPQLEAAAVGLPNMHFLPLQPFDRLGDLLCMADIHFLPQSPDAADLVMPSKLSGMLASGRPVIATCRPGTELNSVVSTCGLVVPPEDSAALAAAIIRLADDPELRRDLGRRARSHAEAHFEREAVLGRVFASCEKRALTVVNDAVA